MSYLVWLWLGLLSCSAGKETPTVVVTDLPDGITMRGGETLHQLVATWEVYVTLDPPPYPEDLVDRVKALGATLTALNASLSGMEVDLQAHGVRGARLLQALERPAFGTNRVRRGARRDRRGLLDVGGRLLHAVFRVATSAQLDRFKAAMGEVEGNQREMVHAHNNLATILNQTRVFAQRLSVRQQHLQLHVDKLTVAVLHLSKSLHAQDDSLRRVEIATDVDRYLDVLTLATQEYLGQIDLFHRQRAELELGRLTRDLLSPDQLREILHQASDNRKVITAIEWYYRHLTVTPLWHPSGSLLYKVELPLIADRPYLMYSVMTHPVPVSNSSFTVMVILSRDYAIDTTTGRLFMPQHCIGHDPVVCQSGVEYGRDAMQCARGILTQRAALVSKCKVEVAHHDGHTIVTRLTTNQYVVATNGETLLIHCPGRAESHINLPQGTHNLTCLDECMVSARSWSIRCIGRVFLARHYVMPLVQVSGQFHFVSALAGDSLRDALPTLTRPDTPDRLELEIADILRPTPLLLHRTVRKPHILSWVNLALLCVFWVVVGVLLAYWRHVYSTVRKAYALATGRLATGEPRAAMIEDAPAQESPPTEVARETTPRRTWASLPPLGDCLGGPRPIVDPSPQPSIGMSIILPSSPPSE